MLFVDTEGNQDPHANMALEEYLMRHARVEDDLVLFYINQPSVIVGRNQNAWEEVNTEYLDAQHIPVVRRLSGGGAVYHDLGNLNFSFITRHTPEDVQNFRKFTAPAIQVLRSLGVPAEMGNSNDIQVHGMKISGNAQYIAGGRMITHGTLLFSSDLTNVERSLQSSLKTIESRAIKSRRSKVANVSEFLHQPLDIETFQSLLLSGVFQNDHGIQKYDLTSKDWNAIRSLVESRYETWEWNYGNSPDFTVDMIQKFPAGEINARIEVRKGLIYSVRFTGKIISREDAAELERALLGARFSPESIHERVNRIME